MKLPGNWTGLNLRLRFRSAVETPPFAFTSWADSGQQLVRLRSPDSRFNRCSHRISARFSIQTKGTSQLRRNSPANVQRVPVQLDLDRSAITSACKCVCHCHCLESGNQESKNFRFSWLPGFQIRKGSTRHRIFRKLGVKTEANI